jgi:hypothetical protein
MTDKHNLREEFPEFVDEIHQLKLNNAHFVHLSEKYAKVNHEINLAEEGLEPLSDEALEALKLERLTLKDEIYAMLQQAKSTIA